VPRLLFIAVVGAAGILLTSNAALSQEGTDTIFDGGDSAQQILAVDSAVRVPDSAAALEHRVKTALPEGLLFGSFTKEDGPYLISGNVIVPSGQILEFGPACTVYVGGNYSNITVFGQMVARGTVAEPVVFMSSKIKAERWDWDRIYCRSRNRSVFEHCSIRNSNYGIYVENGSATIEQCRFENNSLHGVVVKNADVSLDRTSFTKGHAIALYLLPGAVVKADSMQIKENITGIYCSDSSSLNLYGGKISNNAHGIIVSDQSLVEIIGTEVSKNKTGVIATHDIPSKMKEMVYENIRDIKVTPQDSIKRLCKEPLQVAAVVLPSATTALQLSPDFKAGFSALTTPKEPAESFIGNVTAGFSFYRPESKDHPKDMDTVESYSPRSDSTFDTTRTIKKVVNYQTKYPGEQSKKWYAGIQPELQFFANGRRGNTDINLLMDLYSNQWLSTADYFGKNMFNLTMNYTDHQVVIGDFLESGSETSITGRQMTGIKYTGKKFDMGRGEKRFEFKLAAGETEIAKDSGDHEVFVYNQNVDTGMSKRQQITYITEANFKPTRNSSVGAKGIIAHDQYNNPLLRSAINDPAAFDPVIAQTGVFTGNVFLLDDKVELFGEIDLGSADTLSDTAAEKIAWYNPEIEKAFPEVLSLFNPTDFVEHSAGSVGARGTVRDYNGSIRYLQVAPSYFSAGDPYLVTWRKNLSASVTRPVNEKIEVSGSYEFDRSIVEGADEESDPVVTDLNIGTVDATYVPGEALPSFSINYTLQHQRNDARESVERSDSTFSVAFDERELSNRVSLEGKQTFQNGMAYSVRYQMLWDNDYSEHPDKLLSNEGDRFHNIVSGWYSFKYKKIIRNKISIRFASKNENRDSLRAYQYKLTDQFSIQLIPRRLSCTVGGEYTLKSEKEYNDTDWGSPLFTKYYGGDVEVKYSITSRLSCSTMGRYEKSYDELTGSSENYTAVIGGFHLTYLF